MVRVQRSSTLQALAGLSARHVEQMERVRRALEQLAHREQTECKGEHESTNDQSPASVSA